MIFAAASQGRGERIKGNRSHPSGVAAQDGYATTCDHIPQANGMVFAAAGEDGAVGARLSQGKCAHDEEVIIRVAFQPQLCLVGIDGEGVVDAAARRHDWQRIAATEIAARRADRIEDIRGREAAQCLTAGVGLRRCQLDAPTPALHPGPRPFPKRLEDIIVHVT